MHEEQFAIEMMDTCALHQAITCSTHDDSQILVARQFAAINNILVCTGRVE
jgi:hypothetical protein